MQYESAEDIARKTNEYLKEKKIDCEIIAIPHKIQDEWLVTVINKR